MNLINIPALQDNYIWILHDDDHTIIIDPGLAQPAIAYLQQHELIPTAILLTHHHGDHTDGVSELVKRYPHLDVYGPEETVAKGANWVVKGGDAVRFDNLVFSVLDVPGHTRQHVAFYCAPYLFCGDTLFSGGCGRVFEGTHEQMYHSLMTLAQLPEDTLICCAHEYTLSNLTFAHSLVSEDKSVETALSETKELRQNHQPTLPSRLDREKKINLFLRCSEKRLKQALLGNYHAVSDLELFIFLRNSKDRF